jgi:putative endonuclease
MINKRAIGDLGEELAAKFLRQQHYKIIARNFQTIFGEIDIIAKHQSQLIFVEVKMKRNQDFGLPEEELTFYKKRKIAIAIKGYFLEKKITTENWRFDLVAIELGNNEQSIIRHYQGLVLK